MGTRAAARTEQVTTLRDFVRYLARHAGSEWVYRGHRDRRFELKPTIGRDGTYSLRAEKGLFRKFVRQSAQFGYQLPEDDWGRLARAQHHGLPTRLLDWSANPLAALFFAVEPTVPDDTDGEVIAYKTKNEDYVRSEMMVDPFAVRVTTFYIPAIVTQRIGSQRGLFSMHHEPTIAWEPVESRVARFFVPARAKSGLRRELHGVGIDDLALFPDIDGLCRMLRWQYHEKISRWLDV